MAEASKDKQIAVDILTLVAISRLMHGLFLDWLICYVPKIDCVDNVHGVRGHGRASTSQVDLSVWDKG